MDHKENTRPTPPDNKSEHQKIREGKADGATDAAKRLKQRFNASMTGVASLEDTTGAQQEQMAETEAGLLSQYKQIAAELESFLPKEQFKTVKEKIDAFIEQSAQRRIPPQEFAIKLIDYLDLGVDQADLLALDLFGPAAEQVAATTDFSEEDIDRLFTSEDETTVESRLNTRLISLVIMVMLFLTACAMPVEPDGSEDQPDTAKATAAETTDEATEISATTETKDDENPTASTEQEITATPDIDNEVPANKNLKQHLVDEGVVGPGAEVQTIAWNGGTVEKISITRVKNKNGELVPITEINPNATMRHYVMPSVEGQKNEFTAIDTGAREFLTVDENTGEYIIVIYNAGGALEVNSVLNEDKTQFILIDEAGRDPTAFDPVPPEGPTAIPTDEATVPATEEATTPPTTTKTTTPTPTAEESTTPEETETPETPEDATPMERYVFEETTDFQIYSNGEPIPDEEIYLDIRRVTDSWQNPVGAEDFPYFDDYQGFKTLNGQEGREHLQNYAEGMMIRLNLIHHGYTQFGDLDTPYSEWLENFNATQEINEPLPPLTIHGIDVETGEYTQMEVPIQNFVVTHVIDVGPTFGLNRENTFQFGENSPELPMYYLMGNTNLPSVHGVYLDKNNNQVWEVTRLPINVNQTLFNGSFETQDAFTRPYFHLALPPEVQRQIHTEHEVSESIVGTNLGRLEGINFLPETIYGQVYREEGVKTLEVEPYEE